MDEQNKEKDETSSAISSNDMFTTIYDITKAIFRHLPIRSIDSCSLVCKSWADFARFTKTHRHTIHALTYSSNSLSSTATTSNCSYLLSDFDIFISSYINNNLWSIPSLAFVVTTINLEKKGFHSIPTSPPPAKNPRRSHSQTRAAVTERCDISQALVRHLNKSCKIFMVSSPGIIVSNDDKQSNEFETNDAMGILLFPQLPSNILGIYPFEIPRNAQVSDDISRADLHRILGHVPEDISIRCVIFFVSYSQNHTRMCMKKLQEYYSSDVAIIGGFSGKVLYNNRENDQTKSTTNTCGIVLTGDRNHLNIKQVLLEPHMNTREVIRDKLKQLKSPETHESFSFGIQISCVARGSDFYNDEKNVECSEFRNLFPNTPLIGIFGNGEIGHNYLSNINQTTQQQQEEKQINTEELIQNFFHSYSTIFSRISLRM